MIQLQLIEKPKELTAKKVSQFVATFKKSGSSVYNKPYIKTALLKMSNNKCSYCECLVNKEGYAPIEHFLPKSLYPNKVVTWGNLLSSCTRCNTNKGDFDTGKNPFIHPINDIPKEHLQFKVLRFFNKTLKGKNTVEVLKLNHSHWFEERFELQKTINKNIENLLEQFKAHLEINNQKGFQICQKQLMALLKTCSPTEKFSSITSSFVLNAPSYDYLKMLFQQENLWNEELEKSEQQALKSAL